jgi:hypothetical protein
MSVRGITGSLNRGDVNGTIERYSGELLQCVAQRPRRFGWVGGRIDFHFKIGPTGQVLEIRPTASTVGYHKLELCLTEIVSRIQFPVPNGRDKTEFDWGMDVDPHLGRVTHPMDKAELDPVLAQYAARTYEACQTRKKTRFEVTAYIGSYGKLLTAGMIPSHAAAFEQIDCLLDEMTRWKLPRIQKRSKVTFTLKWHPPPPPKAKQPKRKNRKRSAR